MTSERRPVFAFAQSPVRGLLSSKLKTLKVRGEAYRTAKVAEDRLARRTAERGKVSQVFGDFCRGTSCVRGVIYPNKKIGSIPVKVLVAFLRCTGSLQDQNVPKHPLQAQILPIR